MLLMPSRYRQRTAEFFHNFTFFGMATTIYRQENTKLIYSESPANPTLGLCDIAAISDLAKKAGVLHVCDSTFATPLMMKPIDLGADMTLHRFAIDRYSFFPLVLTRISSATLDVFPPHRASMTKFFDGHNMCVGGCVASATKELDEKIHFYMNVHGNIMSPQVCVCINSQAIGSVDCR